MRTGGQEETAGKEGRAEEGRKDGKSQLATALKCLWTLGKGPDSNKNQPC